MLRTNSIDNTPGQVHLDMFQRCLFSYWKSYVSLFKGEMSAKGCLCASEFSHLVAFGGRWVVHKLVSDHAVTRGLASVVNRDFVSTDIGGLIVFFACI